MRINNRLPAFGVSARHVLNDALREGARDGLIKAKTYAPFQKGALRAESDTSMVSLLKWRISFWIEYARFQEFGGDAKRRVRNYTTGGTGAHYLKRAGDEIASRMNYTFRKHGARAR